MRGRQHVNPLGLYFEQLHTPPPQLPPGRPVEIEIGCADAQFLFERAANDPGRTYVGLEIRERLVIEVNARAAAAGAPVQAILCNANHHLADLFPPASVSRVYLNFPDPWFKHRHRKRRMIDAGLVADIHQVAAPGAEVLIQTDVWAIALDALESFERADALFANRAAPWSFWKQGNPYGVRSWREVRCQETGLPIWRLLYASY